MKIFSKLGAAAILASSILAPALLPTAASAMLCRTCSEAQCQILADKYSKGHYKMTHEGCSYAMGGKREITFKNFDDALSGSGRPAKAKKAQMKDGSKFMRIEGHQGKAKN